MSTMDQLSNFNESPPSDYQMVEDDKYCTRCLVIHDYNDVDCPDVNKFLSSKQINPKQLAHADLSRLTVSKTFHYFMPNQIDNE